MWWTEWKTYNWPIRNKQKWIFMRKKPEHFKTFTKPPSFQKCTLHENELNDMHHQWQNISLYKLFNLNLRNSFTHTHTCIQLSQKNGRQSPFSYKITNLVKGLEKDNSTFDLRIMILRERYVILALVLLTKYHEKKNYK